MEMLDVLYPSGVWWADRNLHGKVYRTYRGHQTKEPGDQQCWEMNCTGNMGGCGASISADSEPEVIAKWNRRVSLDAMLSERSKGPKA